VKISQPRGKILKSPEHGHGHSCRLVRLCLLAICVESVLYSQI